MDIIIRVTGEAIFFLLLLLGKGSCMTGDTLKFSMAAMQFKFGIPVVIKFGFFRPAGRGMAFLALRAKTAAMGVV